MRILLDSVSDFFKDDGPILAGAISCFSMLAIMPFLIFLVSIFGYLLGQESPMYPFLLDQVVSVFPDATHQITRELESIMRLRDIAIPNLLVYAFFSYQLYGALESGIQHVFKVEARRPLGMSVLISFFTITLLVVFIGISFSATWFMSLLHPLQELFPDLQVSAATHFLSRFAIPVLLVFMVTTALYMLLPRRSVALRHAVLGSLFASLFLEAAKHLFTLYMAFKLARLGAVYGSLTAIITFLMWLFFAASIFLIGAELVHNLEIRR